MPCTRQMSERLQCDYDRLTFAATTPTRERSGQRVQGKNVQLGSFRMKKGLGVLGFNSQGHIKAVKYLEETTGLRQLTDDIFHTHRPLPSPGIQLVTQRCELKRAKA